LRGEEFDKLSFADDLARVLRAIGFGPVKQLLLDAIE